MKTKKHENDRNLRLGGIIGLMGYIQLQVMQLPSNQSRDSVNGIKMKVKLIELDRIMLKIREELIS